MAKESMITRTIKTTTADILCLDVDSGEACNRSFVLPRVPKKEKEILAFAAEILAVDEPSVHPVHVVNTEVNEKLYGMPESTFLKYAEEIHRNTKNI